ncbi:hypothetical protein L228DRAFT_281163 [Xylona heveae TC161]|uniref:N-acetyltransferase domain-containing protein n=1 Tax=Xylona heveae (strain CBS 132557 / TC161) TaxID=1328760 RepID=A0A165HX53_XYLHT|nr:hypothetical protein L228DRAFT_281163 [Xylona heveae TC161]KZF24051.1 hypothetical protein L228DRAFT_281163 [Xylona heveae TC161]
MHQRLCRQEDFSDMATLSASAFKADGLFAWLHPRSDVYYGDFRRYFINRNKTLFNSCGTIIWVMVTDEKDAHWTGKSEIMGYAVWKRHGQTETAKAWQRDTLGMKLERMLLKAEDTFAWAIGSDRSVSWENVKIMNDTRGYTFFDNLHERWHLSMLAVGAQYQRLGVGSKLIDWGFDIAQRERVPVTLVGSPLGTSLYRKKGFKTCGLRETTKDIVGTIMLWEPSGMDGMFFKVQEDGTVVIKDPPSA